ncbi:hypothetical protein BBH56_02195 [Spiribacter roseus]|uniref:hypothetical protein n=1 Tax=Spiribacter roseus TaxID=1855875 RepID=UPI000F6D2D3A|nr:hypothetical protein BBH56_02195 [Spiribacter roseus]
MPADRGWWDYRHLGAPAVRLGWQHGSAGRIDEGCRVDCWLCGDATVIRGARFEVFGEVEIIRAAAWVAAWLEGRTPAVARTVTGRWLAEAAGLPDEARAGALCIEDAMRSALTGWPQENGASDEH